MAGPEQSAERQVFSQEYKTLLGNLSGALAGEDNTDVDAKLKLLEDFKLRVESAKLTLNGLALIVENSSSIFTFWSRIQEAVKDGDSDALNIVKREVAVSGGSDLFKKAFEVAEARLDTAVFQPILDEEPLEEVEPKVELLTAVEMQDAVTTTTFVTQRELWVQGRRAIATEKSGLISPVDQTVKKRLLRRIEGIIEETVIFEEDNITFFARNPTQLHILRIFVDTLNRTKQDIESLSGINPIPEVEDKKTHKSFGDLQVAETYINDMLQDPHFNPNDPMVNDGTFVFVSPAEKNLSALQLLQARLQKAKTYQAVYSPGRAKSAEDLDFFEELEEKYIYPAESVLVLLEGRVNVLNDEKFEAWKQDFYDNLDTQYPNLYAALQEASKALPTKPYGSDTPESRLAILIDPSVPKDTLQLAYDEIASIDVSDPFISALQKKHVGEVTATIERYITKLQDLITNDDVEKKAKKWETETQKLVKVINEANKVLDPPPTPALETAAVAIEGKLVANYNLLLEAGYFDVDGYADAATKAKIISLVGKDMISGEYGKAQRRLEKILKPIKEKLEDPSNMTWEQLLEVIEKNNIDVYDHAGMAGQSAKSENVAVYNAFNKRKNKDIHATLEEEQRRIDFVSWIVLSKIESINMNEGPIPTCTRPDLFPMLIPRQMSREVILKATTYHPEHGMEFRRILDELIVQVATPGSAIFYDILTGSGNGRVILKDYISRVYKPQLLGSIYKGLSRTEQEKKVEHVLEYINVIYTLFDLLTVSFAELQKQTKTSGHQRSKQGRKLEGTKNWVLICRPDCGLVHDTQRYDSPSNWSAHWLTYMNSVPDEFGRRGDSPEGITYHEKLIEQQKDLLLYQDAHFDAQKFSGKNGIPPTTLFEPIFPDTRTFLHLAPNMSGKPEMLEFGNDVWGLNVDKKYKKLGKKGQKIKYGSKEIVLEQSLAITEWYEDVAMGGWEKILKLTFGELPAKVTDHMIIEQSNMGGEDPSLGLMDIFLNIGCGTAKMYPGKHMDCVAPLLTHYILRIFARYETSTEWREHTFRKVVSKIQNAAGEKGGLGGYASIAAKVIRNISSGVDKWSDEKILKTHSNNFEIGDALVDGIHKRKKQRIAWMLRYYHIEHHTAPKVTIPGLGSALTTISAAVDRLSADDQLHFWKCVNGVEPLPDPGVNRTGSLFKTVDDKH